MQIVIHTFGLYLSISREINSTYSTQSFIFFTRIIPEAKKKIIISTTYIVPQLDNDYFTERFASLVCENKEQCQQFRQNLPISHMSVR